MANLVRGVVFSCSAVAAAGYDLACPNNTYLSDNALSCTTAKGSVLNYKDRCYRYDAAGWTGQATHTFEACVNHCKLKGGVPPTIEDRWDTDAISKGFVEDGGPIYLGYVRTDNKSSYDTMNKEWAWLSGCHISAWGPSGTSTYKYDNFASMTICADVHQSCVTMAGPVPGFEIETDAAVGAEEDGFLLHDKWYAFPCSYTPTAVKTSNKFPRCVCEMGYSTDIWTKNKANLMLVDKENACTAIIEAFAIFAILPWVLCGGCCLCCGIGLIIFLCIRNKTKAPQTGGVIQQPNMMGQPGR